MASVLQAQAMKAVFDDHFELAVELYTQAILFSLKDTELFAYQVVALIEELGNKFSLFTQAVKPHQHLLFYGFLDSSSPVPNL